MPAALSGVPAAWGTTARFAAENELFEVAHPATVAPVVAASATPIHSRRLKRSEGTGHSPTREQGRGDAGDG